MQQEITGPVGGGVATVEHSPFHSSTGPQLDKFGRPSGANFRNLAPLFPCTMITLIVHTKLHARGLR